ncbi:unnamed protein product [Hydatigera taeniaeformis]|uniref:C2H2-type domain-containing protein n=1 Tax=Hydatigena taeniaeformis TaxID=6205 RepID=A0A0R3X3P9_HYDTA|nr:unnamed protein product [Hydatigera taeniaeformis]
MDTISTKPEAIDEDRSPITPSTSRRRRSRAPSVQKSTPKRPRTTASTKSSRGGKGGRSRGSTARTKAAKSAVGADEADAAEDFTALAASALDYAEDSSTQEDDDNDDDDDDDDAGSDYVPDAAEADHNDEDEFEEMDVDVSRTPRRRRGRRSNAATSSIQNQDDDFDISDYEDDDDGMQESRVSLMNEVSAMQDSSRHDEPLGLFSDMAAAVGAVGNSLGGNGDKDIYDFDAQSIASDKRFRKMRQSAAARQNRKSGAGGGGGGSASRSRPANRPATQVGASWGSNIYSALATSLKTRADLDAYTNFLKCPYLNNCMDSMFVDMCRPSNQHMGLFFGPSASLQSLMGRVNDPDKVVELLHAFMSKSYDTLANRILWFVPIIHQQPVPLSNMCAFAERLSTLSKSLDSDMAIEPAYILEGDLNVLVQTGAPFTDLEVSLIQQTAINSAGHMGRFMTDVHQIILSNDFWDQLNDLVALPYEKIISYAERGNNTAEGDASVNLEAIEPPCLHRIIAAVNSENKLLGIALTDTWDLNKVPLSRKRRSLNFENLQRGPLQLTVTDRTSSVTEELPIDLDTYGVLEQILDDVATLRALEDESAETTTIRTSPQIGRIHLMDCFLLKPNSRKDALILVCYEASASPPMPNPSPPGSSPFKVYSLVSEENFFFSRFGITSDSPALMDGMFTADPEALIERKAVAILPDLVFNNLRSIALREVVASSGTAIVNAVLTNINTDAETPSIYRCSKFILVDSQRRVPLAIVFEVPIRLSWIIDANECSVRPLDTSALNTEFSSVTADTLSAVEAKFSPNITECRLVVINGLLYSLQVDENRVLQRIVELLPAGYGNPTGHPDHAALAPQAVTGDARASSAFLRIFNEESSTSSVFPMVYLPHFGQQTLVNQVASFCDELVDHVYTSPVSFSLYDVVFRMAIKHTPKMLARQHREAAEAAAAASAEANPNDPPPPPVPMPEHWGVCSICSKELHSVSGLLEHELRHIGLTKFRCPEHGRCFMDRRALLNHMQEHADSSLKPDDEGGGEDGGVNEVSVGDEDIKFFPGLTNVFARSSLLSCRMESPQCEGCRDYFPTADVMAQHLEICDGISFSTRSPLEQGSYATSGNASDRSVCGICGQAVDEIKQHFTDVHLTCLLCGAQLHTIEELSYHYKVHVEDNASEASERLSEVSTCETCLNFYSSKHNYYFHQWAEHGVIFKQDPTTGMLGPVQVREPRNRASDEEALTTKLKCKFCQFVCPCSGKQYVDHLQSAHDITSDVSLVCRFCAEIFGSLNELSNHLQANHAPLSEYNNAGPQTVYRCDVCTSTPFYAFHKGMLDHAREVHNNLTPNMYECPHCRERFSDRRAHRLHVEKHAEGVLHPCTECGKEFRSKQALMHHIQMRHDTSEWEQGPATCEHCGITYPKRSALKYHIARMHNLELLHECPVCQQRFRIETYLRRHMKETHSGPIKCEICQKQCANLRCYSQHRQKHFRDKIFQCTECSVSFKSKTAMRRHVRVEHMQLGPEKFECQICGKIVTQIGMHMLTHKDARFKCIYCDKQFTKSVYYNEHVRIHLGQLPFECHICGRRFNKKSNLNVHLKFHEKHRDEDGNYLQLKARGRVSIMFGDASLTPEERAAKNAALKNKSNKPTQTVAVGPDLPGAFNVGGAAGAASDACAKACGGHLTDVVGLRPLNSSILANHPHFASASAASNSNSVTITNISNGDETKPAFV